MNTDDTILIFGRSGQVARELSRRASGATCLGRAEVDLATPEACADAICRHAPDAVINAAAFTAVDQAETQEALATTINAQAPTAMALACANLDIPLVHISTDYVFDGAGSAAFMPEDPPAPLGAYGHSKLAGEEGVRAAGGTHVILRTSWVFAGHGGNFVRTMLRLGGERDRLHVVADQIGGPAPAAAIAAACLQIAAQLRAAPNRSGTYHLAGADPVSWAGFARAIMAEAGLPCVIEDILTRDYPTAAPRPLNSRLDCSSLTRAFGIHLPDWRAALPVIIAELQAGHARHLA